MSELAGYTYRNEGAVKATTAGAQTNYPLELIVGESSGASGADVHCCGNCEDFPNDIRFTKEDKTTKHDYWVDTNSLEGTTPNRKVSVIIEVASIPASGAVNFYMYYGKSGDSGESNGDNTFESFDNASAYNQEIHHGTGGEMCPSVVKLDNGNLLLAFYDDVDLWVKVYRSTDNGESWSLLSTPYASSNSHPDIASNGANDVWIVSREWTTNFHSKKSTDGGATWASAVNIRACTGIYDSEILYVSSSLLLVVIADNVASPKELEIWKSVNGGTSWTFVTNATTGTVKYEDLNLEVAPNSDIVLTYEKEWVEGGHSGVFCVRSTDDGATWGSEITIYDDGSSDNEGGALLVDGSDMYQFIPTDEDKGSGSYVENNIKRFKSTDNGLTWGSKTLVMDTKFTVEPCVIKTANSKVLFFGVRQFASASKYIYQIEIDMATPKLFGSKWSQDQGLVYSILDGTDKVLAVEGRFAAAKKGFVTDSLNIADCIIEYSAKGSGSIFDTRSALRYTDVDNHYLANHTPNDMDFYKRVSGAYTQLSTVGDGGVVDTWYNYKIQILSTSIKTWVDNEARTDIIDSIYTTGKTGLSAHQTAERNPVLFKDYRVRKYVSPEPAWGSWGGEEEIGAIQKESGYYAKLGGTSLWLPSVSDQNFTITYEENNVARFSFLLQNCTVNRTAITDHLTDDFVIYHGDTPIFTGTINSDGIEYMGIDKIRIPGYAKSIELGYEFYKHMLSADAEAVGGVQITSPGTPSWGDIGYVLTYEKSGPVYNDQTTEANNATINDVQPMFDTVGDILYYGNNTIFESVKIKYSTKGILGSAVIAMEYSKGSGVWGTLSCVDGSNKFTENPGTYTLSFTPPGDWVTDTVDGKTRYWIRYRLTANGYTLNPILDQLWGLMYSADFVDKTTEANNVTENDIEVDFNGVNYGIYIGHNEAFYTAKVKYSTKGVQSGTLTLKIEYSKGSSVWGTLDHIDTSYFFTADTGEHYIMISNKPSDWAKDTINSVEKFWIRIILVSGGYATNPKLDQIWISQTDVCRVQYDNLYLDDMLDDVLEGTGYTSDAAVPHIVIPGIRGEYHSKLQWVAGLASAATWEDGDGYKQNYLWWIDSNKVVYIEESTGVSFGDITSKLSVLTNKIDYFDIGNRLFSLGSGDGINQTRAVIEDISSQTANGLREALVTDARILEYNALKEFTQKALTVSKTAQKVISLSMSTFDWFEGGYAISDTIKLHQPIWGIPEETEYRIIRCDIGKDTTKIDVGDPRQHLDTLQADLKAQIDVSDIYMAGATNIYAQSVQGNMERTATNVYPLILKIRIPDDAVKINKVLLDWTLSGFRTYTSVAADGGGCSPTSGDGGADAVTSGIHNLGSRVAGDEYAGAIATVTDNVETDAPSQTGDYVYLATDVKQRYLLAGLFDDCTNQLCTFAWLSDSVTAQKYIPDDDHTSNVDLPIALGEATVQHDHTVAAYGNHTHSVAIADHTHTVTIPDHTHPLTSGIIQESLGSPTLELYVNSVLVDNNYTGSNSDVNIAGYMNTGTWNEIKLQPKEGTVALLRAELNAFIKLFIRSR